MASDLLTSTLLTARCPVLYAPAMHTEMWEHPATQHNVSVLRGRGAIVVDPAVGRLTGPDTGRGRLPEPAELFALAEQMLSSGTERGASGPAAPASSAGGHGASRLSGRRVLISAGGTREEIDPVRFLGNWSTGRQGYAFARAAVARGAEVTVVAANVELPDPAGATVIRVVSAREMHAAMLAQADAADAVVMTAAVADFRPVTRAGSKIKKDGRAPEPIALTENPDILADLVARRAARPAGGPPPGGPPPGGPPPGGPPPGGPPPGGFRRQVIVGFAAETDPGLDAARDKLARKGCDLLVVNPVGNGQGFGTGDNEAFVLGRDGTRTTIARQSKDALADVVLKLVEARLNLVT